MFEVIDLGTVAYDRAWAVQQRYFETVQSGRENGGGNDSQGVVLLCEHPHVYTLGRSGEAHNLLVDREFLASIGASYYHTDRGGDITYHGPGQLVGYPILNLGPLGLGLKQYIDLLEQSVIQTIGEWGLRGERLSGATGVWIEGRRKICAIGVRASRFVTMHGFALNVTTDLSYFGHINPCGFVDKEVTSMARELGGAEKVEMEQVKAVFIRHFSALLASANRKQDEK